MKKPCVHSQSHILQILFSAASESAVGLGGAKGWFFRKAEPLAATQAAYPVLCR